MHWKNTLATYCSQNQEMCEKLNMFLYKNAIFRSSQIESNNVDSFWYQVVVATRLQLSPPSLSPPSLWSPLSPPSLRSPLSPPQDHHYGTIKLRSNEARINAFQPNPCHHSWRWNYFINNSLVFVKDTRPARREWAIHSHLSTSSKKLKCCRCLLKNCLPPPTAMICWPLLGRFNHAYHCDHEEVEIHVPETISPFFAVWCNLEA